MGDQNNAALIAGAVPVIGGVLSSGINAVTQGAQNRKNRAFAREQYATQRADALSDWATQNEYNHPSAQMKRLKEAGLNPNLVYGNGAQAQSQGPVRSSTTPSAQGQAPQVDLQAAQGLQAYQGQVQQESSLRVAQKQIDVMEADRVLKEVNANKAVADTNWTKFRTQFGQRTYDAAAEAIDLRNQQMRQNATYTSYENRRKEELQPLQLQKMAADIQQTVQSTKLTSKDIELRKEQIATALYNRLNIQPKEALKLTATIQEILDNRSDFRKINQIELESGTTAKYVLEGLRIMSGLIPRK